MKRRWIILVVITLILVVDLFVAIILHHRLRAGTEKYIAELKAKGERMDIAQLVPPPVPPEQNGSDALRKADEMFLTNKTFLSSNYFYGGMKMVAPGKAAVVAEQPDYRDYDQTNSWEEIQSAVAQNADAYALLHQIIQKPNFNVGIDYGKGIDRITFTNLLLPEAKMAAGRLGVAGMSDLHEGHAASAVENVRAMLAVAEGMRAQHLIISELVRMAIVAIAIPDTWEILQSTNATDTQLAALQKDWANIEFFHAMENTFEMENASAAITANKWRDGDPDFDRSLLDPPTAPWIERHELSSLDRLRLKSRIFRWRYWWSYPDEIRQLQGNRLILEGYRAAQTNNMLLPIQQNLQANIEKFPLSTNEESYYWFSNAMNVDLHFALSDSVRTSAGTFKRVVKMEIQRRMVATAIALKRYYLKHGAYPAGLDALVPEFLSSVPHDLDGKFLRYQRNADGSFTLYSVGDNGVDNGGDPAPSPEHKASLQWQFGRDWVWPQPATAAEIQQFYAKPPK